MQGMRNDKVKQRFSIDRRREDVPVLFLLEQAHQRRKIKVTNFS